jgi:mono/diheme cytochrome c family protein
MPRWIRRIGVAAGGLAGLLALATAGVYGASEYRFRKTYSIEPAPLAVAADDATIARGRHIATAVTKCVDCHGDDLGGRTMIDDPAMGRLVAANITRGAGGVGAALTERDLVRAIRHGVGRDGHPLKIMPSEEYSRLSDEDLAAIVAYVQSLPPVDRPLPPSQIRVLPRALLVTGQMSFLAAEHIDHAAPPPKAVHESDGLAYGKYLVTVGGCVGCHGPNLSGGKIPGTPPDWKPAANITPRGIGTWTERDFITALRTGRRPAGTQIDTLMPWRQTAKLTDGELKAMWAFLKTVPARDYGNR